MMITSKMREIVTNHPLGMVATVNSDGTPNASPKATMVVVDDSTIIFGEIRSPRTLANILERPAMEISFVDVLARKCFRAKGSAVAVARGSDQFEALIDHFQRWDTLMDRINNIICLRLSSVSLVTSPAYDVGQSEEMLKEHWRSHYASL